MRKRLLILGLMAVLVVAGAAPSFAARAIAGAVGNVSAADGALLSNQVGFRIYSAMPGGQSNINFNTSSCRNIRCLRAYSTNPTLQPGGFNGNQEATNAYNGDATDQPYYMLVDGCLNDNAANHIGFYGIGGVTGNNSGIGSHLSGGCSGTTAQNCFSRLDSTFAQPDLANTYQGFGGNPHSIRPVGGLNGIPNVRVKVGAVNGCPANSVCLSWNDPSDYGPGRASNDAPAPGSPLQGVTLYQYHSEPTCIEPTGAGPWDPVPGGQFPANAGAVGTVRPLPAAGCDFYALRVRVTGPAGLPNTIETGCVGVNSQPVAAPSTAVRIVRFNATYAGHGVVNVAWTSGIEGDVSGFYVTRSASANGPFARVSDLVPATGDNSHYLRADRVGTAAGRVYYYQLQVLGRDGNVTTSTPAAVTLPGRTKKAGPSVR